MTQVAGAAIFAMLLPAIAWSQSVTGIVRESSSAAPVPGVVITLEQLDAAGTRRVVASGSVLSDTQGRYAVRAGQAGTFRIVAKRIGMRAYVSRPFALSVGETVRRDLRLEATPRSLDEIVVARPELCTTSEREGRRVVALWDEVSTALTATRISLRDSLFHARVTRYRRHLLPRNLRVVEESRTVHEGAIRRPFTSLSGDSLSKIGWWSATAGDSLRFDAPDHEVLLSDAFVRDHCFRTVEGRVNGAT